MPDAPLLTTEEHQPSYTVFQSASDVPYLPENVFKEGVSMVKTIKEDIKKLQIGSNLRKDVWLKEIEKSVPTHSRTPSTHPWIVYSLKQHQKPWSLFVDPQVRMMWSLSA